MESRFKSRSIREIKPVSGWIEQPRWAPIAFGQSAICTEVESDRAAAVLPIARIPTQAAEEVAQMIGKWWATSQE